MEYVIEVQGCRVSVGSHSPGMFSGGSSEATRLAARYWESHQHELAARYVDIQGSHARRNLQRWFGGIEAAVEPNPHLALTGALVVPDAMAAIAQYGGGNEERYTRWLSEHAQPHFTFDGEVIVPPRECYLIRCDMLHRGQLRDPRLQRVYHFDTYRDEPVISPPIFEGGGEILFLPLGWFVGAIVKAARDWIETLATTQLVDPHGYTLWYEPVSD